MTLKELYEKRRQEGNLPAAQSNTGGYTSLRDRYLEKQRQEYAGTAEKDIRTRASTWLKNHDTYMQNYTSRFQGRTGTLSDNYVADAAQWNSTVQQQRNNFVAEYQNIMSILDEYGGYYDQKWVEDLRKTLTDSLSRQEQVLTAAQQDAKYWSTWADEAAYTGYRTQQQKATRGERMAAYTAGKDAAQTGKGGMMLKDLVGTKAPEEKRTWFQPGAMRDGYQAGDLLKSNAATAVDMAENAGASVLGMGEKILDALATAAPYAAQGLYYANGGGFNMTADAAFAQQTQSAVDLMKDFAKKDLYDEQKVAQTLITDPVQKMTGIDARKDSYLGDKSDALVQSAAQLAAQLGLQSVGVPWWLTSGATALGSEAESALQQGANLNEAALSGMISAGAEVLTEKISGVILPGSGKALDDILQTRIARGISNKLLQKLAKAGVDMAGEGLEEVASGAISKLGQWLTYRNGENLKDILFSEEALDEALESFIGGAVLGGVSGTVQGVTARGQGKNAVTGLTKNEQAVVDKVYGDRVTQESEGGKKLTAKQKDTIYNRVLWEMDRGYIATDTIEAVLGENAAEAVKQDRLAESYAERGRRSQSFQVDAQQHTDPYARQTVENFANSGLANNTNLTHDFVDFLAKVSADKQLTVDATTTEKLKNSIFGLEGVQVDGFVAGNGITLNLNSAKALNSLVGHEVTHVLEGTAFYDALQETITTYAKGRNDYDSRLEKLSKLYSGIEGYRLEDGSLDTGKVEREVVADLVGEYLFTDTEFIQRLSVEDRDVFDKIFDEIDYLCRVATAGSKEARQLEKVKKAFEDAYRAPGTENTAPEGGVRYSITEPFVDSNGTKFDSAVLLDTDFFDGLSPRNWGGKLRNFVEMRSSDDPFILPVADENGNVQQLQFANLEDRVTKNGGSNHKVLDELSRSSDNVSKLAVVHIDEIVEVSDADNPYYTANSNHQWLDQNGWLHRTATVINARNGNIYTLTLDIAKAKDGRHILYATSGNIKRVGNVQVNSLTTRGSGQNSNSNSMVTEPASTVKRKNLEYQYAVEKGDLKAAQRLVDQAARDAGYTIKAYHGTDSDTFTVFDKGKIGETSGLSVLGDGFYFADKKSVAAQYGKNVYTVYIKQGNPYNAVDSDAYRLNAAKLEADGFDGVVLKTGKGTVFMVLDPEQVKSAEPVTYDDEGNVIPLSQRFNEQNEDIRYSVSEQADAEDAGRGVRGKDILLEEGEMLPIREDIAPVAADAGMEELPIRDDLKKAATTDTGMEDIPIRKDLAGTGASSDTTMMDLPIRDDLKLTTKADKPKEKQHKWVKTSTDSKALDRAVLITDLDQNMIAYRPISNNETVQKANDKLGAMGYDTATQYFNNQIYSDKVSVEDIALGERLILEAVTRGETQIAGELIQNVAILGTELGQKVQALSIIQRMTPEGQLGMLRKIVNRGKAKGDITYNGVEITQDMIDYILGTYNKDGSYDPQKLNKAVEDVKQKIADQMGVTKTEKINAWRYLSMLGNPKTHIRNLVSNFAMSGTLAVKDAVARSLETIAPIVGRTKTWRRPSRDVKDFARLTTAEMKNDISGEGKYSNAADIKSRRKMFNNKILQKVYGFNSDLLGKEDWWFSKTAFKTSLQEFLTANGIETAEDIEKNPGIVEKGKRYALERAEIATFRQYSWLASKISSIEQKNAATQIAVGSVIPFKKTPINVAKAGLSYSPLGFVKTLTYDIAQVKKSNMDASTLVDHLSQNITGTGLALVGFFLAKAGLLNGAGEDDKEATYDYYLGEQAYSVNIGGNSYTLSWMSPIAMPLFVGVNIYEQLVEGKEWNADIVLETLAQTLDPMSEMSFLSSLDDVLSSYDSGMEKFAGIGISALSSYASQFVPTALSQAAATIDGTKRTTKVAADSGMKVIDEVVNQLMYKIPVLRQILQPSTDIWGNEIQQGENVAVRAVENFVAPWTRKANISSEVDEEIKNIYSVVGDDGVIPSIPGNAVTYKNERYQMSAEEYTDFKKVYGQVAFDSLEKLFQTETYRRASDEEKADMISEVYSYAMDTAKREYLAKEGVEYTNATKNKVPYYRENPIKGAIENDTTAEEYSYALENSGKYAVAMAVGGYEVYRTYIGELNGIEADKNENGQSINGSRKEKVKSYIDSLDAEYGEKLILFKREYPADDTYNREIVEYLDSREDLTYSEVLSILKELGFELLSDGTVKW